MCAQEEGEYGTHYVIRAQRGIALYMPVLYLSDEAKALQSLPMALQESSCDVGLARPS